MKTFGDLCTFISVSHVDMDLFGCDEELEKGFSERCKAIGLALCQERNITPAKVMELPPEAELGEESRPLAESLKTWFSLKAAAKK